MRAIVIRRHRTHAEAGEALTVAAFPAPCSFADRYGTSVRRVIDGVASLRSSLPGRWIAAVVGNGDDDHAVVGYSVEDAIGEPLHRRPTEIGMNRRVGGWIRSHKLSCGRHFADEINT